MPTAPGSQLKSLVASLWQRNRPLMLERLASLERAATDAANGRLTPAQLEEAESIAHKLAGSLGMFGLPEGTAAAQKLELLLRADGAPDPKVFRDLTVQLQKAMFPAE